MSSAAIARARRRRAWPWRPALAGALLALAALAYAALGPRPSNARDWEFGMATLAAVAIHEDTVTVGNVRDFRYAAGEVRSAEYFGRTYAADRIERVWLVVEPFVIGPFAGFGGVAHTYFVFDFRDQPPVAVSVEARRERGETYDALRGLLGQFELIYVWGTEQDLTGRRAVFERNPLYMYPLRISAEGARELFLQMARATLELEARPRFYNTFTSNCTNELAYAANRVRPGAIPPNVALVFPGYADEVLYDLGFIPTDAPLAEVSRRYFITDLVLAHHEQPDFSARLRRALAEREAGLPSPPPTAP
jgi:hypothetical protein